MDVQCNMHTPLAHYTVCAPYRSVHIANMIAIVIAKMVGKVIVEVIANVLQYLAWSCVEWLWHPIGVWPGRQSSEAVRQWNVDVRNT